LLNEHMISHAQMKILLCLGGHLISAHLLSALLQKAECPRIFTSFEQDPAQGASRIGLIGTKSPGSANGRINEIFAGLVFVAEKFSGLARHIISFIEHSKLLGVEISKVIEGEG